jgi:hypothetical protein
MQQKIFGCDDVYPLLLKCLIRASVGERRIELEVFEAISEHYDEYQAYLTTINSSETYIGLEPYGDEYRTLRFDTFSTHTKSRYGLMLDTGAPESCCGQNFLDRFLEDMQIDNAEWSSYTASLSGIGAGSAAVNWKCRTPIGIANFSAAVWETQVLEGCGKNVPGLMGLQPMTRLSTR